MSGRGDGERVGGRKVHSLKRRWRRMGKVEIFRLMDQTAMERLGELLWRKRPGKITEEKRWLGKGKRREGREK